MKKLVKKIIYNKTVAKFILPILLKLDNLFYQKISRYSVILNDGVHPKHHLMNYHQFFVDNISGKDIVLDIGCGIGENAFDMAKKAQKVVGIDLSPENIAFARKNNSAPNIEYIFGDATKDLGNQKFDVIVLSNVLEHIEKRPELLSKISEIAPKILIRVPMINRDWLVLYKKEQGIDWRLDDTHYIEYTYEIFKEELAESGLYVEDYSIQYGEIWAICRKKN